MPSAGKSFLCCFPRGVGSPWGLAMTNLKLPYRRQFLHLTASAAALSAVSRFAFAQAYPSRPITLIAPVAPGSSGDVIARVVAERMKNALGQPIIIENVGGADGSIGVGRLARARPDGYTIDIGFLGSHVMNGAFYSLPYDLLNDFEPIALLTTTTFVLYARKSLPAKDLNELIAWLKANPDKTATAVTAASQRLFAMLFQKETETRFGLVPYRGGANAIQDLVAGQVDMFFDVPAQLPQVRGGNIRAYAVASDTRLAAAPDIPTFAELGWPTVSWSAWFGFFAAKGVPKDIIVKLNAAVVEALADQTVRSRLADLGLDVVPRERQTPETLGALVKSDAKKWWPLIKEFGIKTE
jgi:tripartite-type tricarboxylate transporter receptor subunit TctC